MGTDEIIGDCKTLYILRKRVVTCDGDESVAVLVPGELNQNISIAVDCLPGERLALKP